MEETITIVLVIIGALIGAGFASGQEIYTFFYSHGVGGLIGICITFCMMGILIYKSLKIIYNHKIDNYDEFLEVFIKNKKITQIINIVINILLLIIFYVMIAGFGAYFEQELRINKIIGSLVLASLSAIVFFSSVKGVLKVNEYIVPILIIFIIFIGYKNLLAIDVETQFRIPNEFFRINSPWLLSALTYCSYNFILLVPVLISLRKQIKNVNNIKYIAILSGTIMIILSIMIFMILMRIDVDIRTLEMPVVYIVRVFFPKYKLIYSFIILASILTTAISIGIGFLQNVSKSQKSYTQFVLFMCITSLIISNFGFSKLVNLAYPIFGYLGFAQLLMLIFGRCLNLQLLLTKKSCMI